MAQLWPLIAIGGAGFWLGQAPPAEWPGGPAGWQGPALLLLLAGVFGLLHQSSSYLQTWIVGFVFGLTRNLARANGAYFALMRPGVFVHELAHAITGGLVGGRILSFNMLETSVDPAARGGQVRLGHVSYAIPGHPGRLGFRLRDAFVGLAPLPFGLLLIAGALGLSGLDPLGDPAAALPAAASSWRFWLALLAVVEIADHMTPSRVDRKNWPAALLLGLLLAVLVATGLWLFRPVLPPAWWATVVQAGLVFVAVLAVPIALNLVLGALFWILARPLLRRR